MRLLLVVALIVGSIAAATLLAPGVPETRSLHQVECPCDLCVGDL